MAKLNRVKNLYSLVMDFLKKCNDDHVAAFGAMSAFFMLLSMFPFMIFFLTLTKIAPFSKDDIINILIDFFSFEKKYLIMSIVNEIYRKTAPSVFTISIIAALWSSSRGVYSIVKGLNSVYDIDDNRNYFVVRIFSLFCTVIFAFLIVAMLILWVFGNGLYHYICEKIPVLASVAGYFIHKRVLFTIVLLTILFMFIYKFVPGRESSFRRQWPGALVASLGWIAVSAGCSFYMDNFSNFSYVYGSMAGIMILLLWLYFCMSMIFYGAEVNYFLENKKNYHLLIRTLRPNFKEVRREKEKAMRDEEQLQRNKKKEMIRKKIFRRHNKKL